MTDQPVTQEQLSAVLNYLGEVVKRGDNFVTEQAPLLAQDIVAWEKASGLLSIGIGAVLLVIFVLVAALAAYCWRRCVKGELFNDWDCPGLLATLAAVGLLIGGLVTVWRGSMAYVRAEYAPRVVVLEYVRGAVK